MNKYIKEKNKRDCNVVFSTIYFYVLYCQISRTQGYPIVTPEFICSAKLPAPVHKTGTSDNTLRLHSTNLEKHQTHRLAWFSLEGKQNVYTHRWRMSLFIRRHVWVQQMKRCLVARWQRKMWSLGFEWEWLSVITHHTAFWGSIHLFDASLQTSGLW